MNARAKRIRAAASGRSGTGTLSDVDLDLIAAMLEAATAKPVKAKVAPADKLPVSPVAIFEAIRATEKVLCEPVDNRWFGRLGAVLKQIKVEQVDLDLLCEWLQHGGIDWWTVPATFDHAIANLGKWLAASRKAASESNTHGAVVNWVSE